MNLFDAFKSLCEDYAFSRFMTRKRAVIRDLHMVRRRSDGTVWAGGASQSFAYAMRGLFSKDPRDKYHFWKVREFHGCNVVSRKVFWIPTADDQFHLMLKGEQSSAFLLQPFDEETECRMIDRIRGDSAPPKPDPVEVGKRIRIVPKITSHPPETKS